MKWNVRAGHASTARIILPSLVAVSVLAAVLGAVPTVAALSWSRRSAAPADGSAPPRLATYRTYGDSLRQAAGAREYPVWLQAGRRAVERAPTIRPPYAESGRFSGDADARGYRVELLAGERLNIELDLEPGSAAPFLDLFVAQADAEGRPFLSRSGATALEYRARTDGPVLVRLQPRLGGSGGYDLKLRRVPALVFPVVHDAAAVIGAFLEARDGGARRHRGIDIHAPRGTPVVAAADGVVERVDVTELGGLVVWLRETDTNRTHYYAHLDTQRVRRGARVRTGETVGTVGNTGNASETAPHLHFGIYRSGTAVNPLLYLDPPGVEPADPHVADHADPTLVGVRARTRVAAAGFRTTNEAATPALSLPRHSPLQVLAAAGRSYRVRLDNGAEGFLAAWLLERD